MRKLLDSLRMPRLGAIPDHPLDSPREAERIFNELRAGDAARSLEEICDWLDSMAADNTIRPERRSAIIRGLDDLAQPHRVKIAREMATHGSQGQDVRNWQLNRSLWQRLGAAYEDLMRRVEAREKGVDALRKEFWHIAVRGARSTAMEIKWLYMRYGPVPDELWARLAHAYRFAEERGLQLARATGFGAAGGETCPEEEFLHALLLSAAAPDALVPAEIDIADRLIVASASRFRITREPQADSTYWFDLEKPRAPLRLAAPPAVITSGLRFFATAAGFADVQSLLQKLEKSHELPRGVDLGAGAEPESVARVLRHLRANWAPRPPVRRTERRRTHAGITVVHGMDNVLSKFHSSEIDLDFGADAQAIHWEVENTSNGGLGASMAGAPPAWIRIGALVGLSDDAGTERWDVGILRRLSQHEDGDAKRTSVGVQVLSRHAMGGVFTTNIGRWSNGVPTVAGIVIPEGGEEGAIQVVLPSGLYLPGEQLLAMIGGRRHLLFPVGLAERGADYDLIKFRALVQAN